IRLRCWGSICLQPASVCFPYLRTPSATCGQTAWRSGKPKRPSANRPAVKQQRSVNFIGSDGGPFAVKAPCAEFAFHPHLFLGKSESFCGGGIVAPGRRRISVSGRPCLILSLIG